MQVLYIEHQFRFLKCLSRTDMECFPTRMKGSALFFFLTYDLVFCWVVVLCVCTCIGMFPYVGTSGSQRSVANILLSLSLRYFLRQVFH